MLPEGGRKRTGRAAVVAAEDEEGNEGVKFGLGGALPLLLLQVLLLSVSDSPSLISCASPSFPPFSWAATATVPTTLAPAASPAAAAADEEPGREDEDTLLVLLCWWIRALLLLQLLPLRGDEGRNGE